MTTIVDKYELIKRLTARGNFKEDDVADLADVLNKALGDEVATKQDLGLMEARLEAKITVGLSDMKHYVLTTVIAVGLLQFGLVTGLLLKLIK
jgi:hypothetical protein